MKLGFAQDLKAQFCSFNRSAGPQVVHLIATHVTKTSIKMGTIVSKTMDAGAQELLSTAFIEFEDIGFTLKCT